MIVRRFYEQQLAQYSYLIGCPTRDRDRHRSDARRRAVRRGRCRGRARASRTSPRRTSTRTSCPARGSSSRAPARRCSSPARGRRSGATHSPTPTMRSCCATATWWTWVAFALTAMHTPGHTPEHLSFLVKDLATWRNRSRSSPATSCSWAMSGDRICSSARPTSRERRRPPRGSSSRRSRGSGSSPTTCRSGRDTAREARAASRSETCRPPRRLRAVRQLGALRA